MKRVFGIHRQGKVKDVGLRRLATVDVFFNKPLSYVADDGHPVWYLGKDQYNKPYFRFQERIFGYGRVYPYSFINDMGFFSKTIARVMLSRQGYTVVSFLRKSYDIMSPKCFISEY